MSANRIKVLIADDSSVSRMLLTHLLNSDPTIEVIATVNDGQAALNFLSDQGNSPDVAIMDIHMPHLDGFEATRRIMETRPLPIVICTATADPKELVVAFRSLEAGAVACVEKPVCPGHAQFAAQVSNLLQTIRVMAEVKVVRRWPRARIGRGPQAPAAVHDGVPLEHGIRCVGIGASTGGPPVLQTILAGLNKDFPAPLLIVQHIARGFLTGMVEWLHQTTRLDVHVAAHGTLALPGHVYIAPDDSHLGFGPTGRIVLAHDEPESGLRPAVSYLFRSLAKVCGPSAIGVLLTGMGRDGAEELKSMRDHGAWTIAQDRDTSIVHGMPGAAIDLGAASEILPAGRIAASLIHRAARRHAAIEGVKA